MYSKKQETSVASVFSLTEKLKFKENQLIQQLENEASKGDFNWLEYGDIISPVKEEYIPSIYEGTKPNKLKEGKYFEPLSFSFSTDCDWETMWKEAYA